MDPRYLTKSRFKIGLECPTKLYYTKKNKYVDAKLDDEFLKALAEGGFQVGELAKLYFPGGIDIDDLDYQTAIGQTDKLLKEEHSIIYEAAFLFENLFIRADIVIKNENHLELIEVKAKSFDPRSDSFIGKKGGVGNQWRSYLEDIAFQKHVVVRAYPDLAVTASLMLVDKSKTASVDGLNQRFFLFREGERTKVKVNGSLDKTSLGDELLIKQNVDGIIDGIYNAVPETGELSFEQKIRLYSDSYSNDKKILPGLGGACGKCEFRATEEQLKDGFRSGFRECWEQAAGFTAEDFGRPSILEVWDFRKKDEYIEERGIYFQSQMSRVDLEPRKPTIHDKPWMSRIDRQELQVQKSAANDPAFFLDKDRLSAIMKTWKYPLHFIDFETTSVAIPFHMGRRPYEAIAFQYSHHVVSEDGTIEHKGEWINAKPGFFPNFEFLRALKKELENDNGTIFRYAIHENTILNSIYKQLKESSEHDREDLCSWIKTITHSKMEGDKWEGPRDMVDLKEMVVRYYYDPFTRGSNSIKQVLPAVLNANDHIKNKYSQSIYGNEIKSSNFSDHKWIKFDKNGRVINPYFLLPAIHEGYSNESFDEYVIDEESGIYDGGAAMTAYARMQFTEMSDQEKERIVKALLRYCELDTMAMVFIWEAWSEWIK